jgi:two-component system cell cycle sensor histidine kinase/response regulator CckA
VRTTDLGDAVWQAVGEAYRLLFEQAREMVCLVDRDGRLTAINKVGEELTGHGSEDLVGTLAVDLLAPELRGEASRRLVKRLAGGAEPTVEESLLVTADGRLVWVEITSSVLRYDERAVGALCVVADLEERRRTEDVLRRGEQRLREVLAIAPDGMVLVDANGSVVLVNARTEELFGYARHELIGKPVETLLPAHAGALHRVHRRSYLADPIARQMAAEVKLVGRRRDGSEFPVEITLSPIETDAGRFVTAAIRDVSARVGAERQLAEREQHYRLLAENSTDLVTRLAPDGTLNYVSPACEALLGYLPEELLGRSIGEFMRPEVLAGQAERAALVDAASGPSVLETQLRHRDGRWLWFEATVRSVREPASGQVSERQAALRLIEERKRAEADLHAVEARFRSFFEDAPIGEAIVSVDGRFLQVNDALCRIVGYSQTELLTKTFQDLTHADDLDTDLELVRQTLAGEIRDYQLEKRYLDNAGRTVWALLSVSLVRDQAGEPSYFISQIQDISERKQAEDQLTVAAARYRALVEQLPLGTYVRPVDISRPNLYVSPQLEAMLGYSAEEWETDPGLLARVVHPDDRERAATAAARVRESGVPLRDEYRFIARDGRVVWVQDETHRVIREDGREVVQGFLLDISDRKQAEAERDRLQEQLHQAQKLEAVGRLAGGVAHDVNNTLTAIRGYSELLLAELGPGTTTHHQAGQIRRAAEQASALPAQLLAFSRNQTLEPQLVDLNILIATISELVEHLIGDQIELTVVPASEPALVRVDPAGIESVLVNLALNARDAMPDGGTLTITTTHADAQIAVAVTDNGEGMDAATAARAFEPFFTTKAQGAGSGLGLASVHGIVGQSGGSIRVVSDPASGTTFEIRLPAVTTPVPAESIADPVKAKEERLLPARPVELRPVVLVVEDEEIVREYLIQILTSDEFDLHTAANGEEALRLLGHLDRPVDVLVTDMVMPGLSGRMLADRLKFLEPDASVIFISGYHEDAVSGAAFGPASTFLRKPFSPATLLAVVREALRTKTSTGTAGAARSPRHRLSCLIADDHPAVIGAVADYLDAAGFSVSNRSARSDDALREIMAKQPALALIDIALEPFDGIELARQAKLASPDTGVVLYTGSRDPEHLRRAFATGIRGFVVKDAPLSELVEALTTVAGGGTHIDSQLAGILATTPRAQQYVLTERQRQILTLISSGHTNEKIAATLNISPETVQTHVKNAMQSLGAGTRSQAVAAALRHALIA